MHAHGLFLESLCYESAIEQDQALGSDKMISVLTNNLISAWHC